MPRESTESFLQAGAGLLSDLRRCLEIHRDEILFAYLFGSFARGDAGPRSDLDLAVYFVDRRPHVHHTLKIDLYMTINRLLKQNDVDIVVLNTASNLMLLDEILRQGIVLLDADPQFREDFELRTLHLAMDFREQRKTIMGI